MNSDIGDISGFLVLTVAVAIGLVCYLIGSSVTERSIRQEAIDAGVAEYVFSDKYGKAEFRFKSATTAIERASE